MIRSIIFIVVVCVSLMMTTGALFSSAIDATRLANALEDGDDYQIIDVRTSREYASGHLPGAEHVSFWKIYGLADLWQSGDKPVVLYCQHGPRAWLAAIPFWFGQREVRVLEGHYGGWASAGLQIEASTL